MVFTKPYKSCTISTVYYYDRVIKLKAVIAMSGGVDSSVAACIMKERGYEVCGITLKLFDNDEIGIEKSKTCCSLDDVMDARRVADSLGMPFYVFNFGDRFSDLVIDKFVNTYIEGGTPNPCIDCNRFIKFNELLKRAHALDFEYIVTGHYARISKEGDRYLLKKAVDTNKDQSYVLYFMSQHQLSKTIFPLGELTKPEVREIAGKYGFVNADKPESQDICFVREGKYADFIENYTGIKSKPGSFVNPEGHEVGRHKGIIHYTTGQRRGLGLSVEKPVYVCGKNPQENTVTVGSEDYLFTKELVASDINLIAFDSINSPERVFAKTRYRQKEEAAVIEQIGDDKIHVSFEKPQRAVTRGQAVVFYRDDVVVGGGTIE